MKKTLLTIVAAAMFSMASAEEKMVAYLFTYFTGNAPDQEQICYALSDDGYNYTPLNGLHPVCA